MGIFKSLWAGLVVVGTALKGYYQVFTAKNTPAMVAAAQAADEAKRKDDIEKAVREKDKKTGGIAIGE